MLKAGYMEDWVYGRTYSGTPQGGVVSPLLANIYLHELDRFMQAMQAGFDKGRKRRALYQAAFRGFANYYAFADDAKRVLGLLELVVFRSLVKTLAMRHGTSSARTMARLWNGTDDELRSMVRDRPRSLKLWRLKHLTRTCWTSSFVDNVTAGAWWIKRPNDLIGRLKADQCEACGDTTGPFEVHHLRRVQGLRSGSLTVWKQSGWRRKTIVLCRACRAGVSGRKQTHVESRVH